MKIPEPAEIIETLERKKPFSMVIKKHTLTIRERKNLFEVLVSEKGAKPSVLFYRRRTIAVDRYLEQCEYLQYDSKSKSKSRRKPS